MYLVFLFTIYLIFSISIIFLNDVASNANRMMHNLFISLNSILFASYIIFITSKLFNRQKNNNLVSLERRNGYSYKEIILSRLAIIVINILFIFLIVILINGILYSVSNKNILMNRYYWISIEYYLFVALLIFSISVFLITIFNFGVSNFISILIVFMLFTISLLSVFLISPKSNDESYLQNKYLVLNKNIEFEKNQNINKLVNYDQESKEVFKELNLLINKIKINDNYLHIFSEEQINTLNLRPLDLFLYGPGIWNGGFDITNTNPEFQKEFPSFSKLITEIKNYFKDNISYIGENEFKDLLNTEHMSENQKYFNIIYNSLKKINLSAGGIKELLLENIANYNYDALNDTIPFLQLVNNKEGINVSNSNQKLKNTILENYKNNWEQYYIYKYLNSLMLINNYINNNKFKIFQDETEKNNYYDFINKIKTNVRFNPLLHVSHMFYGEGYNNRALTEKIYDRNDFFYQPINLYIDDSNKLSEIANVNGLFIGYSLLNVAILIGSTFIFKKHNFI
ncbi:MARVEL domain-containing protein [Spiroplasma syrphidicola]|nr:MARVEL domain-containing protein [Spiroplasma syrphidicola]